MDRVGSFIVCFVLVLLFSYGKILISQFYSQFCFGLQFMFSQDALLVLADHPSWLKENAMYILRPIPEKQLLRDAYVRLRCTLFFEGISGTVDKTIACHVSNIVGVGFFSFFYFFSSLHDTCIVSFLDPFVCTGLGRYCFQTFCNIFALVSQHPLKIVF